MVVVALATLIADAASKAWASAALDRPIEIGASLSLQLSHNPGVAFGVGQSLPSWLLLALSGLICVGVTWGGWTGVLHPPVAVGLVVGGAVGNLLDRMTSGSVVDMIHLTWWPTFNLADAAICIGVVLLVLASFRSEKPAPDELDEPPQIEDPR